MVRGNVHNIISRGVKHLETRLKKAKRCLEVGSEQMNDDLTLSLMIGMAGEGWWLAGIALWLINDDINYFWIGCVVNCLLWILGFIYYIGMIWVKKHYKKE